MQKNWCFENNGVIQVSALCTQTVNYRKGRWLHYSFVWRVYWLGILHCLHNISCYIVQKLGNHVRYCILLSTSVYYFTPFSVQIVKCSVCNSACQVKHCNGWNWNRAEWGTSQCSSTAGVLWCQGWMKEGMWKWRHASQLISTRPSPYSTLTEKETKCWWRNWQL